MKNNYRSLLSAAVIVAALGYFVDIYDLLLFNIVRMDSLRSIGYSGRELEVGLLLHNIQMTGLMIGGIFWGMLADKKGRLSVLFGSIFLYSTANFFNSHADNFTQYAFCRFFAGLGLAGELGAGITLVTEVLPSELRGYGTMIVATVGVTGAIVGGFVAQVFDWRVAYQIGGVLGFLLLILRIGVAESGIFKMALKQKDVRRGNFFQLFTKFDRFKRFSLCILAGIPIWYTIGILVAYAPEFAKTFQIAGTVSTAKAVLYCYVGFTLGDFASGLVSQLLKSRLKSLKLFIILNFVVSICYLLFVRDTSLTVLYAACVILGTTGGYWAVVVTIAAEQFGTNLRATVATTVPNFIRFGVVPLSLSFLWLKAQGGVVHAGVIVSVVISSIAYLSARKLPETFGKNLDYLEET